MNPSSGQKQSWKALGEAALDRCLRQPVTTDPTAEIEYLRILGGMHVDTVDRVGRLLINCDADRPEVLEIGAYFCPTSLALASGGARVTAQDVSTVLAQSPLRERLQQAGIRVSAVDDLSIPLPYSDHSFDALVCTEVMEHLPFNAIRLVREFRRILRPGGFAFLSVPNQASAKRRLQLLRGQPIRETIERWAASPNDDNWHWREYVDSEFVELIAAGGFSDVALDYRHFSAPSHPNPLRRKLVEFGYRIWPHLKDDLCVVAR